MKQRFLVIILLIIIAGAAFFGLRSQHKSTDSQNTTQATSSNAKQSAGTKDSFNKNQYSLTDPTSIWVIVNKVHPLQPKDYIPADLVIPSLPLRVPGNESMQMRQVTADALTKLFAGAKAADVPMMVSSGYRSYSYQVSLYGKYVQDEGQATADTQSARPGYSEHQTGLAVDVEPLDQQCDVDQCFGDLPAGKWLAANAYKYGFIIRYPSDKTSVTGYEYEPWHIRYVGVDLATEMHNKHIETLEEFFNVPGGTTYKS